MPTRAMLLISTTKFTATASSTARTFGPRSCYATFQTDLIGYAISVHLSMVHC